jgi:hypothetical protein
LIRVDEVDIHPLEKRWNLLFFEWMNINLINPYQPFYQPSSTNLQNHTANAVVTTAFDLLALLSFTKISS